MGSGLGGWGGALGSWLAGWLVGSRVASAGKVRVLPVRVLCVGGMGRDRHGQVAGLGGQKLRWMRECWEQLPHTVQKRPSCAHHLAAAPAPACRWRRTTCCAPMSG